MAKQRKMPSTADDTEAAFYAALARADIEALMALWAEDEDIACIHPGAPRLVGYAAIRASWEEIFKQGSVLIHPVSVGSIQNLMIAVHNVIEELKRAETDHQNIHVLATNIYMKTPQGWRIVLHHASIAPGNAASLRRVNTMLH
jgi:ketosteroid isomerase-like protein